MDNHTKGDGAEGLPFPAVGEKETCGRGADKVYSNIIRCDVHTEPGVCGVMPVLPGSRGTRFFGHILPVCVTWNNNGCVDNAKG